MVLFCVSCDNGFLTGKHDPKDIILAEVGDKKLFQSELENVVQKGSGAEDSLRILKGLVNNWVKDQLMILEAEKNMPKDINLNKMIEDYRSSLMLYNYETKLANEMLDTVVTAEQKREYYNAHADEFVLSEGIARFIMAKFPVGTKEIDKFHKDWKNDNVTDIGIFCKHHAEFFDLDGESWKTVNQMQQFLPKNLVSKSAYGKGKDIRKKEKDYEYFIKIYEYTEEHTKPPFDYIASKIEKVILNDRKRDLLRQKKQQLYDKESGSSKVNIYVK